jgi:hypothetical protein
MEREGRHMGFLIRSAFWFSLVLLAMPFGAGADGQQSVGPFQALSAARDAIGDIAGICERKPDVCETGKAAMYTISVRAKKTAEIAASMMGDDNAKTEAAGEDAIKDEIAKAETVKTEIAKQDTAKPDTVTKTGSIQAKSGAVKAAKPQPKD